MPKRPLATTQTPAKRRKGIPKRLAAVAPTTALKGSSEGNEGGPQLRSERVVSDMPAAAMSDMPAAAVPDEPAAAVSDMPAAVVSDMPAAVVSDMPSAAVPDEPAAAVSDMPAAVVSDMPAAKAPHEALQAPKASPLLAPPRVGSSAVAHLAATPRLAAQAEAVPSAARCHQNLAVPPAVPALDVQAVSVPPAADRRGHSAELRSAPGPAATVSQEGPPAATAAERPSPATRTAMLPQAPLAAATSSCWAVFGRSLDSWSLSQPPARPGRVPSCAAPVPPPVPSTKPVPPPVPSTARVPTGAQLLHQFPWCLRDPGTPVDAAASTPSRDACKQPPLLSPPPPSAGAAVAACARLHTALAAMEPPSPEQSAAVGPTLPHSAVEQIGCAPPRPFRVKRGHAGSASSPCQMGSQRALAAVLATTGHYRTLPRLSPSLSSSQERADAAAAASQPKAAAPAQLRQGVAAPLQAATADAARGPEPEAAAALAAALLHHDGALTRQRGAASQQSCTSARLTSLHEVATALPVHPQGSTACSPQPPSLSALAQALRKLEQADTSLHASAATTSVDRRRRQPAAGEATTATVQASQALPSGVRHAADAARTIAAADLSSPVSDRSSPGRFASSGDENSDGNRTQPVLPQRTQAPLGTAVQQDAAAAATHVPAKPSNSKRTSAWPDTQRVSELPATQVVGTPLLPTTQAASPLAATQAGETTSPPQPATQAASPLAATQPAESTSPTQPATQAASPLAATQAGESTSPPLLATQAASPLVATQPAEIASQLAATQAFVDSDSPGGGQPSLVRRRSFSFGHRGGSQDSTPPLTQVDAAADSPCAAQQCAESTPPAVHEPAARTNGAKLPQDGTDLAMPAPADACPAAQPALTSPQHSLGVSEDRTPVLRASQSGATGWPAATLELLLTPVPHEPSCTSVSSSVDTSPGGAADGPGVEEEPRLLVSEQALRAAAAVKAEARERAAERKAARFVRRLLGADAPKGMLAPLQLLSVRFPSLLLAVLLNSRKQCCCLLVLFVQQQYDHRYCSYNYCTTTRSTVFTPYPWQ